MNSTVQQPRPLERLRADVSDTIDHKYERESCIRSFLQCLRNSQISVNDWENVIKQLSSGAAFPPHESADLPDAGKLFASLSQPEKAQLREHYFEKLGAIVQELPDLERDFPNQFR